MKPKPRHLLYIDMAYLVGAMRDKNHEEFFTARHSGGYFDRVWGVHPIADVGGKPARKVTFERISPRQMIIEGVAEGLKLPKALLPLNFLISQARLVALLRRVIRRHDIAVIAATDPLYGALLGLVLKVLTGKPTAIRIYGNYDELYAATGALAMPRLIPFRFLEKWISRLVLKRADLVIAGNQNNLDWGIANGARRHTAIISNAKYIQESHFVRPEDRGDPGEIFDRWGLPRGRPTLLYIGRLLALKHPDDAVRAMAHVIARRPDAIGVLAGSGVMRPELEALVESLGMAGKIHFAGHVNQDDLSRIAPHCITLSPLTGMALIESALAGSPIVAYDRDWQSEFINDGVDGYLVPFRHHEAMGRKALDLVDHPETARRFATAIRAHALDYADKAKIHALEAKAFETMLAAWSG